MIVKILIINKNHKSIVDKKNNKMIIFYLIFQKANMGSVIDFRILFY